MERLPGRCRLAGRTRIVVLWAVLLALLLSAIGCEDGRPVEPIGRDLPVHKFPPADAEGNVHKEVSTTCAPAFRRQPWQWHESVKWTSDGAQVLFTVGPDVYAVGADGIRLRKVADGAADGKAGPKTSFDVSPDGGQLLYSACYRRLGDDDEYDIAVVDVDGAEVVRLTKDNRFDNYPVWSPDGERITFVRNSEVGDDLARSLNVYTMAADGTDQRLEAVDATHHSPQWSPDGKRIAYVGKDEDEGRAIYVVAVDGSLSKRRLIETVSGPTWSPDGERIAFAKADGDEVALYTIAADGTDERRLATIEGWEFPFLYELNQEPDATKAWIRKVSWSPDGSRIMVVADDHSAGAQIFALEGGGPSWVIVRHPIVRSIGDAAWSPDGTRIAMSGEFESRSVSYDPDVYHVLLTMAADGTDLLVLAGTREDGGLESQGAIVLENVVTGAAQCGDGVMVPEPEANPGLVEDCEVLLEIHDRLTGGGVLDWNWHSPISQWQGVVVGGSPPRVRKIVLRGDLRGTIRGTIPPELGRLTELQELYMSRNLLTGAIPPDLGELKNLTRLDLGGNYLSGAIPRELGELSELTHLSLALNNLLGEIPVELGELSNLKVLRLAYNLLTVVLPEDLDALPGLDELDRLFVAYNAITGCIPEDLSRKLTLTEYIDKTDLDELDLPEC